MSAPVIPPRPVINTDDLLEVMIPRGQPFEKIVRIENASKINVYGAAIGLDHKKVEEGVLIFGTVPTDANFTIGVMILNNLFKVMQVKERIEKGDMK